MASKYDTALATRNEQERANHTMGLLLGHNQSRYWPTVKAVEGDQTTFRLEVRLYYGNGNLAGHDARIAEFVAKVVEGDMHTILQRARLLMRDDFRSVAADAAQEALRVLDWAGEEATL
jgi:hypothetical protein